MKKIFSSLLCFAVAVSALAQTHADTLAVQMKDPNCKKIFVVSHRGDWRNAPENSLQAIQNCIDMGVDMVEIDLKKTKDGHLILMHDKTINRTMSGKGVPEDYTLDELKAMNLKNGAGCRTQHKVATLDEAMNLVKGKILVNIDKGYDYFDDVYQVLKRTGTVNQCVIKDGNNYATVKAEKGNALEKMIFMPIVKLTDDSARQRIADYHQNYGPLMYELVFDNDGKAVTEVIAYTRKSGAKLFISSLWSELCGGHHDDRAVEKRQPDEAWGWIIDQGASFIQTDRPQLLLNYLRGKGLHE